MKVIDRQTYSAPKTEVLKIAPQRVICGSVTVNTVTLEEEEDW